MNDATPPPFIDPEMAAILAKAPPPVD